MQKSQVIYPLMSLQSDFSAKSQKYEINKLQKLATFNLEKLIIPLTLACNDAVKECDDLKEFMDELLCKYQKKMEKVRVLAGLVIQRKMTAGQKQIQENYNNNNNNKLTLVQENQERDKYSPQKDLLNLEKKRNSLSKEKSKKLDKKQCQKNLKSLTSTIKDQQQFPFFCPQHNIKTKDQNQFYQHLCSPLYRHIQSKPDYVSHYITPNKNMLPIDISVIIFSGHDYTFKEQEKQETQQEEQKQTEIQQLQQNCKKITKKQIQIKKQYDTRSQKTRKKECGHRNAINKNNKIQYKVEEEQPQIFYCGICPDILLKNYHHFVTHMRKHDWIIDSKSSHIIIRKKRNKITTSEKLKVTITQIDNKKYKCPCRNSYKFKRQDFIKHVFKWHGGICPT